jgi:hypothetical protein
MSQNLPQGIDLSGLPPEIRRKVEAGLARLSPEMRQHWEQQGSPLLAKLVANAGGKLPRTTPPPIPKAAAAPRTTGGMDLPAHPPHHVNPRSAPRGHYNDTIRPGDGQSLRWLPLIILVSVGLAVWYQL